MRFWPEFFAGTLLILGQWHWIAIWCLGSALICGLSYAWIGPGIFRKDSRGLIPPLLKLIHRPWFWEYTLVVAIDRWIGLDPANEIYPGLWLSRKLLRKELPPGIKLVVDMTAEFPKMSGLDNEIEYVCLPTLDGCAPERLAFKKLVRFVASHDGPVLIHCARGQGRSATLMAAVLLQRGIANNVEDACSIMKQKRPRVHLHRGQKRLLNSVSWDICQINEIPKPLHECDSL